MNYKDLYQKIANLFQVSTKEVSIHFHLNIQSLVVSIQSYLIGLNGEKKEFESLEYPWNNDFYKEFLLPMVSLIQQKTKVVTKDMIPSNRENLYTIRFITENNDIFTIEGFNEQDAKKILDYSNDIDSINLFQ